MIIIITIITISLLLYYDQYNNDNNKININLEVLEVRRYLITVTNYYSYVPKIFVRYNFGVVNNNSYFPI